MINKVIKDKRFFQAFFIVLAPLILLAPVYLMGRALFWGTPLMQFIPWWQHAWSLLLEGYLPLWNSRLGMGAPLLANYQSALFYPPNWISFLLYLIGEAPLMAWGQTLLVAMHLIWAGFGMVVLARRLGLNFLAQIISALAFSLSGYLVSRAGFFSINAAVSWLPWVIAWLTPDTGSRCVNMRRLPIFVLLIAMQLLSGHAQITFYTLGLAGIWSAYWASKGLGYNKPDKHKHLNNPDKLQVFTLTLSRIGNAWLYLALAVLLAGALAAVQLIPTAEYLSQSQRAAAMDYDYVVNYSFWTWRLATLFAPGMFGSPVTGDYWGYGNYWEDAIYIGLLPLLLAVSALLRSLGAFHHKAKRHLIRSTAPALQPGFTWFLVALFLAALLLALGKNTPVFPWLYHHIPTFNMFQAPTRLMVWAVFALSMLAGIGSSQWKAPQGRVLYWTRLATMGAFAVMLGAGIAWLALGEISPSFIRAAASAGFWGVGAGFLSLLAPDQLNDQNSKNPKISAWHWVVAIFVCLDLLIAGWGLNPGASLKIYQRSSFASEVKSMLQGKRLYIADPDESEIKYERFLRFDTFQPGEDWRNLRATVLPNINLLDSISSSNNYDPLVPGRYAEWMDYLDGLQPDALQPYLKLMDVGVQQHEDPASPNGIRFVPIAGSQRVRWAPCAVVVPGMQEAWQHISSRSLDFERQVLLESSADPGLGLCDPSLEGQVLIGEEQPGRLVITVKAQQAGWLVLSDVWYPGWVAICDNKEVEIYHADYLFKAVAVPPGQHEVVFIYHPFSFRLGLWITLTTSILLLGLWLFINRRLSS